MESGVWDLGIWDEGFGNWRFRIKDRAHVSPPFRVTGVALCPLISIPVTSSGAGMEFGNSQNSLPHGDPHVPSKPSPGSLPSLNPRNPQIPIPDIHGIQRGHSSATLCPCPCSSHGIWDLGIIPDFHPTLLHDLQHSQREKTRNSWGIQRVLGSHRIWGLSPQIPLFIQYFQN